MEKRQITMHGLGPHHGGGPVQVPSRVQDGNGYGLSRSNGAQGGAKGLGWLSVGLGLAEILAPGVVGRLVGAGGNRRIRSVLVVLGVRELVSGIGILRFGRPARWVWARVAGDVIDLALLGEILASPKAARGRTAAATAAVVGVTALDALSAYQLTRSHAGKSEHRGIHISRAITINRSPEEVYRYWRNFENLPRFMAHLESVRVEGERSRWRAKAPAGMSVEWEAELIADRPGETIAWRSLEGAMVPNHGAVRFGVAPGGRGTEVRVVLTYEPPGGVLGATFAKLFGEEPGQQIGSDLRRLKQVLETGEVIHSDASIQRGMHAARPADSEERRETA
jgi:uncharacterized membrane protein